MRSGLRWSLICSLVMVSAGLAQQVQADPIVVTDGEVTLCGSPRNCIIGSVSLFGDGLSFGGSTFLGFPLQFVNAGDLIDLSQTAFPATFQGRGPFQQVVNGITYRDVFVGGHLDFSAIPFIAPAPPPGRGFFTPFTMHGQISGFADVQHTIPLFSAAVVGSGTAAMGARVLPNGAPSDYEVDSVVYRFQSTESPVPEPASLALLVTGIVGLIGRRSFKPYLSQTARRDG
jgi:hypothetical protein